MRMNARSPEEAALMNARKKEKKKKLLEAIKPTCNSEWLSLGEHWLKWVRENKWSMNLDDYANAHGYKPYTFKKDWVKESPIHQGFLEQIVAILHFRRNEYMAAKDKFHFQILKELPIYNWDYRDYEIERQKAEEQQNKEILVYMDSVPVSNLVPKKQKE